MTSCFLCLQVQAKSQILCDACLDNLERVDVLHACKACKRPMVEALVCGDCLQNPWHFQTLHVAAYYNPMARYLMHQFKFYQGLMLLPQLSGLMIDSMRESLQDARPDVIVPVPLHRLRILWRGFNQAHELAKRVGRVFDIPVNPQLARKIKYTKAQARLKFSERGKHLKSSFRVQVSSSIKHVLIIDDVFTTGNTVNALAQAFVKAGVERVDVLTLFRAV